MDVHQNTEQLDRYAEALEMFYGFVSDQMGEAWYTVHAGFHYEGLSNLIKHLEQLKAGLGKNDNNYITVQRLQLKFDRLKDDLVDHIRIEL